MAPEGSAQLVVALPTSSSYWFPARRGEQMSSTKKGVIIGVDPHKMSVTIEVVDTHERLLGSGRFATDQAGYAAMQRYVKQWPDRRLGGRGRQRCGPSAGPATRRRRRAGGRCAGQAGRPGAALRHRPQPQDRRPGRPLDRGRRGPPPGCGWWSRTVSSKRCGCSPTAATSSPTSGSRRSTGCSGCSANCCLASANGPVRRPGQGDARHGAAP